MKLRPLVPSGAGLAAALLVLLLPLHGQAPTPAPADPYAEIAALKQQLAAKDAEIAHLKESQAATGTAAAPVSSPPAAPTAAPAATPESPSTGPVAPAQSAAASSMAGDETVHMSPFAVNSTQGHGYVATNSDSAFKTNQALIDIPQDMQVVTRDMIDDIGATDSSTILQYFGEGDSAFLGEAAAMRGYTAKYPYVDDMPENQSYEDNFFVDRYDVIRGDAQVLYVLANPVGLIIKYTKQPLPFEQTLATASVNSYGGTRVTFDNTAPIGQLGEVKLSYRVAAVQQGPSDYFYNVHESHEGLYGVVEADIGNTKLSLSEIFLKIEHVPGGTALIAPDGNLLDPAGPREVNVPPNDMEQHEEHRTTFAVDTKATDNWDFHFGASYWRYHRFGSIIEENSYNWANQTQNWFERLNDITIDYWTMVGDASGKWNIGSFTQQDNFGFAYQDTLTHQYLPPPPSSLWVNGAYNAPLGSIAAVNAITPVPVADYPALGSPGAPAALHNQGYNSDIYFQHTLDLIPKYLTGVVGWTWANSSTDNTANVATLPYNATVVAAAKWIHRFGFVFHPIKEVSFYGMTSTGFAPPSGATPILYNGSQAPPQSYEDTEFGVKTNLWDGKLSTTFAVFKIAETNLLTVGPGLNPQGSGYDIPIGTGVGEGYDGDIEYSLTKSWQLVAYGYAGHWLDQNGYPIPSSYDNSWSVFTRYSFDSASMFHGLVVGGGMKQVGGGHVSAAGVNGYTFAPVPTNSTVTIKVKQGFDSQLFATYPITSYLTARLSCTNLTNDHYVIGYQAAYLADEAPPRTFTLEFDLKH